MSATPALVIEYASSENIASIDPGLVAASKPMLWTAILSGLCVASCFVTFTQHPVATMLHVIIYVAILAAGGLAGSRFRPAGVGARTMLDLVASIGLVGIMLAPVFAPLFMTGHLGAKGGLIMLGICFLLMAATTARHVMLYRAVSQMLLRVGRRGLSRSFLVMGWVKTIYEGIWLMCCALPLMMIDRNLPGRGTEEFAIFLALGALFGCGGFGLIWIWMIISHSMLLAAVKKQTLVDAAVPATTSPVTI